MNLIFILLSLVFYRYGECEEERHDGPDVCFAFFRMMFFAIDDANKGSIVYQRMKGIPILLYKPENGINKNVTDPFLILKNPDTLL